MAIKSTNQAKKTTTAGKTKPKKVVLSNNKEPKPLTIGEIKEQQEEFEYIIATEDIVKPLPRPWTPEYNEIIKKFWLTLKQERFCRLYALHSEYFWNWVQSYIAWYNPDRSKKGRYDTAKANARETLTKPYILAYINYLMEQDGFNDEFADSQLSFLMKQNSDLWVKRAAIRDYNELKGRIKQKLELSADQELKNLWLTLVKTPDK